LYERRHRCFRRSQTAATGQAGLQVELAIFGSSTFILRPLRYNRRRLNSSLTQTQAVPLKSDRDLLRTALAVTVVGALWFILLRHLSNEWSVSEQYSYGWFVPFFAAYLFWLRWQDRPDPQPLATRTGSVLAAVTVVLAFATLFPLRL